MCGIVGYIGPRDATPVILNGLKRLEYRGYDSAGLAVLQNGRIEVRREAGKLQRLEALLEGSPIGGNLGIGHTRWATHGEPSARNAHPHLGATGEVVVVHNGIVENFLELRGELLAEGVVFQSDTDTEVIEFPRTARRASRRGSGFPIRYRYRSDRPPDRALPVNRVQPGRSCLPGLPPA